MGQLHDNLLEKLLRYGQGLMERDLRVLGMRSGLEDGVPRTQEEIAGLLGVTLNTIGHWERLARKRLRLVEKTIIAASPKDDQ